MRVLGVDLGERRVGLAISDPSRTLARPLSTIVVRGSRDAVLAVAEEVARLAAEDDGLDAIVVGRPTRLDGSPSEFARQVEQFVAALAARTKLPITFQDEGLTSVEAESRLAAREPGWRARKKKLDAAAAAVMLQDFLDRQ